MKKIYALLFALLISSISFGQQTLPFADTFSYTAGNLHETAPWSALGAPSTLTPPDHILLDGTKVTFAGIGTDAQLNITSLTTGTVSNFITGTVFYRFNLKVISMAGVTDTNGGYLSGFSQNSTTFGGTLWTKRASDDNTFYLGIETRTATGALTTYTSETYNTGTTYTVVVSYTFNTTATADDTVKLWINPTTLDETTPLLTDTHVGTDLTSIASFFFRQDSLTETPSVEIDDLGITLSYSAALATTQNEIAGLKVYPNPVSNGVLHVESNLNTERTISLFDVLGKQVLTTTTSNNTINVAALNSGVYIVKINEGGNTATRKVVIR